MSSIDINEAYAHLFRWLEIRHRHGLDFPSSPDNLQICMNKSALLHRLLKGKEPLPIPPPRAYSGPWYSLIENGEGISYDVWEADDWVADLYPYPTLYISQSPWKILQKIDNNSWQVTYPYKDSGEEKFSEDSWHVYKDKEYWVIKKLSA